MTKSVHKRVLNEASNGVKKPLYFDRQVVRASDLNLDRKSHDEELERMRRLLHGWGIVGGLDVIQFDDKLVVGRGYGITPTGEEVFLRERLEVANLAAHLWACCGPGPVDCDLVDETEIRRRGEEGEITRVTGWLIARPTSTLAEPRPGVSQGCEHPANRLLPTRNCEGVRLELLCKRQPPHILTAPSCEELSPHFCTHSKRGTQAFLAMPKFYNSTLSYLVLCKLVCNIEEEELTVTMLPLGRKILLPGSVMQQFLTACVCPVLEGDAPPPEDGDSDDWDDLRDLLENPPIRDPERDPLIPDPVRDPPIFDPRRDRPEPEPVVDPPRFRDHIDVINTPEMIEKLAEADINGPKAFIKADAEHIARVTGLTLVTVKEAQSRLDGMRHLLPGLRF